jgi:Flp pilus assembly protein TadG
MIRIRTALAALRRLYADRRGNVLLIMGFATIPMTFATGMAIDYSQAARLQTKLDAAADAAALAAVTLPMMSRSDADARTAATNMFNEQVAGLPGLIYAPANLTVTLVSTNGASNSRTATVSYRAASANSFAGVLGMASIPIAGTSASNATTAPNIDFYVLLDTSGSMALPATSQGLKDLTAKTGGCAFACHSTNDATARDKNNKLTDYYGVARSYNISLRIDEAKKAVQDMMTLAASTSVVNKAKYRAALSTFAAADARANNSFNARQGITDNLALVSTAAGQAETSLYYKNSCPTATYCNDDQDTATSDAFNKMNSAIPTPGGGTNVSGDRPQSILFLITDGMRDENRQGGRPEAQIDTAWCNTIKAKGTRIAVLYTEYLAESLSDDWSKTNVKPYLYKVEPALQSCASSGLYYKVTTDDDISAALNRLFQKIVLTAHLTQ